MAKWIIFGELQMMKALFSMLLSKKTEYESHNPMT